MLKEIALSAIRENPDALRKVNRKTEGYVGLVDSVKNRGVLNPILVRQMPSQDGAELFGLVDGLHRYTASLDAGLETIPCQVMNMDDAKAMTTQLIGNAHRIETKPVEYSKHLQRILASDPLLTKAKLAAELNKSEAWISERLGLSNLHSDIASLVDEGKINLSNAFIISKLPKEEQANFVDRAMTMTPAVFQPTVAARKKELDTAKRQGRDPNKAEFTAVPHLQKISDMKQELETPRIGPVLVKESNLTTAEDGFAMGVKWALHLDPRSIEHAKAKEETRKRAEQEKKANAAVERASKRAEDAAEAAARIQQEQLAGVN